MAETTVVTTNEDPQEDGSVLAEAAVLSVGISAGAAIKADDANATADEANARAQGAQATADAALGVASTTISEDDARRIAREEYLAMQALDQESADETDTVEVVEVEDLPEQVLPRSAQKAEGSEDGKKGSWAQRHGMVS